MKKHTNWMLAASLAIGSIAFIGCDDYDDDAVEPAKVEVDTNTTTEREVEKDLNRAGDNLERGAEKTGDALERGAEKTGDALERGMEKTGDALNRAGEKIEQGVEKTGEELRELGRETREGAERTGDRIERTDVDVKVEERPANQPVNPE